MPWHLTRDLAAFNATAAPFVTADPVENTLFTSIMAMLGRRGLGAFSNHPPHFGWYEGESGQVEAVFLQTPPHPVRLSAAADSVARELADALARGHSRDQGGHAQVSGIGGPVQAAEAFVARWCELTGATAAIQMRLRLHRLGTLTVPEPGPPGRARVAEAADRELLVAWCRDFAEDAKEGNGDFERMVDGRIEYGGLTLWETGGQAVSMAGATRLIEGTVRVAPVYTPKQLRGRGFAGAVTAAVSQAALDAGARDVVLFTDLANPTSNALYHRLGYRPVGDQVDYRFVY
jgi:RimJ/RimL family protein N-acetyltransferase